MTIKGAEKAMFLTVCLLSIACAVAMAPGMVADEPDDGPMIFVFTGHDAPQTDKPAMQDEHERMIHTIGEFEQVSERVQNQGPGMNAFIQVPEMKDMNPQERDFIQNMVSMIGLNGVLDSTPENFDVVVMDEPQDLSEIGLHDPNFISDVIEYLEEIPELQDTAEELKEIVILNQKSVEDLGRVISCADTRAAGNEEDDDENDDITIIEDESEEDIPGYDTSDIGCESAHALENGTETAFYNLEL